MGWQQRSKCLGSKSKSAHLVALPYWYPTFLQQTQLLIELLLNIFHSSGAVYILWMYRILHRTDVLSPHWNGCGSRAICKCCMRTCFLVLSDGICTSPFHFIVPLTLKVADDDLRTVPTIVIAHTFCASPDNRISYRQCLLIQGYFCAV